MSDDRTRLRIRIDDETMERVEFWSKRHGVSINQYVLDALDLKIDFENRNYPLTTMEQARLNELLDHMREMTVSMGNLTAMVSAGNDMQRRLMVGDNPLTDQSMNEDGELDG